MVRRVDVQHVPGERRPGQALGDNVGIVAETSDSVATNSDNLTPDSPGELTTPSLLTAAIMAAAARPRRAHAADMSCPL